MVLFSSIFVADRKIVFRYNFGEHLRRFSLETTERKRTISTKYWPKYIYPLESELDSEFVIRNVSLWNLSSIVRFLCKYFNCLLDEYTQNEIKLVLILASRMLYMPCAGISRSFVAKMMILKLSKVINIPDTLLAET